MEYISKRSGEILPQKYRFNSITEKIQKVNIYACEKFGQDSRIFWHFYGKRSKIILFIFAGNVELKMGFFKRPHVRVFFGGIRSRCLALVKYWPICSAPIIRLWQLKSRHNSQEQKNRRILPKRRIDRIDHHTFQLEQIHPRLIESVIRDSDRYSETGFRYLSSGTDQS